MQWGWTKDCRQMFEEFIPFGSRIPNDNSLSGNSIKYQRRGKCRWCLKTQLTPIPLGKV